MFEFPSSTLKFFLQPFQKKSIQVTVLYFIQIMYLRIRYQPFVHQTTTILCKYAYKKKISYGTARIVFEII